MKQVLDAIQFANERHAGQIRRGSCAPYVTHPIAVSYLVAAYKRSKHLVDLLVASILHDVLEDTGTTFQELVERFGPLAASLVLELTNDETEVARLGKLEYQKKKLAGISNYGLILKLADRLHNISDGPTRKMLQDTLELLRHVRKVRKLTRTQKRMVADIESLATSRLAPAA